MAYKRGGQLTVSGEWTRHLRLYLRRIFWKKERAAEKALLRSEASEVSGGTPRTTAEQDSPTLPRKVAVLLYPGCIYFEIEATVAALSRQLEVLHFTPDGLGLADSTGRQLQAQGSYADLEQTDAKGVIVPGGDPGSIIPEQKAAAALQHAAGQGALMAGICAGNLVLASAGLLKGVRATHNYTLEYAPVEKVTATAPYWDGILFERADLVEDRNRITAQPWAYEQFASVVAERLCTET